MSVPLNIQAEGHFLNVGYPASKADDTDSSDLKRDLSGQSSAYSNAAGNGVKPHPKLDVNQFRGVNSDGRKPTAPVDMTSEELEKAASELNLTLNPQLTKQLGNEPAPAETFNPQPKPM